MKPLRHRVCRCLMVGVCNSVGLLSETLETGKSDWKVGFLRSQDTVSYKGEILDNCKKIVRQTTLLTSN